MAFQHLTEHGLKEWQEKWIAQFSAYYGLREGVELEFKLRDLGLLHMSHRLSTLQSLSSYISWHTDLTGVLNIKYKDAEGKARTLNLFSVTFAPFHKLCGTVILTNMSRLNGNFLRDPSIVLEPKEKRIPVSPIGIPFLIEVCRLMGFGTIMGSNIIDFPDKKFSSFKELESASKDVRPSYRETFRFNVLANGFKVLDSYRNPRTMNNIEIWGYDLTKNT